MMKLTKIGSIEKIDKIVSNNDEQGEIINKLFIKELINNLRDRERQIIRLRFYEEKTQSQVSKIIGISQVQVSRIEKRILESLKTMYLKARWYNVKKNY